MGVSTPQKKAMTALDGGFSTSGLGAEWYMKLKLNSAPIVDLNLMTSHVIMKVMKRMGSGNELVK